MNSKQKSWPQTLSPSISRKKRPVTHGCYINSPNALKVRSNRVTHLVRKAVDQMPWLRDEDIPALRKWAELEVIRRAAFAGIVKVGALKVDGNDLQTRRLVDDHRKLALAQLVFERELGMTPSARAQLTDSKQGEFDLVAALAQPAEAAEASPVEPERSPDSED